MTSKIRARPAAGLAAHAFPVLSVVLIALAPLSGAAQSHSRTDILDYADNGAHWVLGQPRKSTHLAPDGSALVEYEHVYDGNALPIRSFAFGKLQRTATYHADGTLATASDGRDGDAVDTTVVYAHWKRGIPQQIVYPDQATRAAVVDDLGQILSVTDEIGGKTCFGHDTMGRINRFTYPSETQLHVCDTSSHAPKIVTFDRGHPAAYGVPAGHWRRTTTIGHARHIVIFDALWRPVVELSVDQSDTANTLSEVVTRYDHGGRVAFRSYPMNTMGAAHYADATLKGTHTMYDGLGRVVRVEEDSEHGRLATTTEYLPNGLVRLTNPRGHATMTRHQSFDVPDYSQPTTILHPEGIRTDIARDVFGKPTSITRSGPGG